MKKTTLLSFAIKAKALFALCIIAFGSIMHSCNEPNTVGLEVQPESDIPNLSFTDTVTLKTEIYREDSALTFNSLINPLNAALLGSLYDAELGTSTANLYTQIVPSIITPDLDSSIFDSLVLTFAYSSFYGDSTTQQTFTVYELDQALNKDSSYYSNQSFNVISTIVGSSTFSPRPNSKVVLGADTLAPHLRIKLDNVFSQNIFDKIKGTEQWLSSKEFFLGKMKGLNIQCSNITSAGGIITYNPNSALSGMTLYYTDTARQDTVQKTIKFVMTEAGRCNQFYHDYSASVVGNVFPKVSPDKAYVQAMAGLRTKVTFPYIDALKAAMPIAINKAELVITLEGGSTLALPANTSLGLARTDSINQLLTIPEQFLEGNSYFGGTLNNNTYRFNIARYLQQVLTGEITDNGLFILPSRSGTTPNRAVFGGGGNTNQSLKLKLQLTYTKLTP